MEKIWFKHYAPETAKEINPDQFSSIVDLFEESVEKYSQKPAYTNMGTTINFQELNELSRDMASFFQKTCGLKKGDRVVLQMPNLIQYPIALFAALRAGLIVVNANPLYTAREMKHQFKDSGAKAIVILANFAYNLEEIIDDTDIKHIVVTELGDQLNFPKNILVNSVVKYVKKMVPKFNLPNYYTFKQALDAGDSQDLATVNLTGDDLAFLQYTGGTTGVSKGAMLTHRNMIANMLQISEWMKPRLVEAEETIITALPLYHIFSLTVNCLSFMYRGGCNLLVTNPKDIPNFIKLLRTEKYTAFAGVNTLFTALMNHPDFDKIDFSQLKISVAGGMALQTPVALKWREKTKATIVEGYGLTEASPVVCCNPIHGEDRVGTVGLPVSSTDVKLVDESGNEVPPGKSGELCTKGPQVMKGYWQKPEETANMMFGDWLRTGDIAEVDKDGFFKVVDRIKDMILVSGFNVFPNEIEEVAVAHPAILEAAAIGEPDEKSGESVKLFVVKRSPVTSEEVIGHCRKNLAGYKVPKTVEFRTELPKTNVGKILRRALRAPN